ncbi:isochorismatase family protein [Spirillospora sp. NPDC047279]|uniref:isochorismatase family protein n=1 Tax=Spirillospora sp. NPDC047279 TaxID=3155478 RepID=UPI0033E2B534
MSSDPPARPDRNLAEDYSSAGFGRTLEWGESPAVIVIDMVRAYFQPGAELYLGGRDCLESAARVVQAARLGGVPVLHTRVAYGPGGVDGGVFYRKVAALRHFAADAEHPELGEIMPEVAPRPDELVLVKQYPSAFFGTSLSATLAAARIDTLVICGVSTSGCVRATAVDAISHGYPPVVVRQAVGDRDPRPHEANLFDLQAKYAEVSDEPEVIERLKRR